MVSKRSKKSRSNRKKCYREPRDPEHPDAGKVFKAWLRHQAKSVREEDKNFTCLCYAPVRSGKSNLSLFAYDVYMNGDVSLDNIGFSVETNMKAFSLAAESKGFVLFDEFNLSRRRSMGSWNVDLLDMLNAVAGLNLGLWANNPSADTIDRDFIEQGLCQYFVFIYAPRYRFYVFTLKGITDLMADHGRLDFLTVKEHGAYYAWLDSYWSFYNNDFWNDYKARKKDRMIEKVSSMYEKYAVKTHNFAEACRVIGRSDPTLRKYVDLMLKNGSLTPDVRTSSGSWSFTEEHLKVIAEYIKNN